MDYAFQYIETHPLMSEHTIHTLLEMETVNITKPRVKEPSVDIMMSRETLPPLLEPPLRRTQSQLPLKPTEEYSNSTRVVSSVDQLAEPTSITVLSLLDSETVVDKTTPSLETHGVDHGETRVTSG